MNDKEKNIEEVLDSLTFDDAPDRAHRGRALGLPRLSVDAVRGSRGAALSQPEPSGTVGTHRLLALVGSCHRVGPPLVENVAWSTIPRRFRSSIRQ